jgi:hypothetical protein
MFQTLVGEEICTTPGTVPTESHVVVRHAGLAMSLHHPLVPDPDAQHEQPNGAHDERRGSHRIESVICFTPVI